jgi:antitoxin FitA
MGIEGAHDHAALGGRPYQRIWDPASLGSDMSKMIQIRDVPEQVHSVLKPRAAREGASLSEYIKRELERVVERPTMREWLELTQRAKPIQSKRNAAQIVRALRDAR